MKRDRGWLVLICLALGTLLALLGLYAGAYYALVQPTSVELGVATSGTNTVYEEFVVPIYSDDLWIDGNRVFAPVHAIDRWLRPTTWAGREIDKPSPQFTGEAAAEQKS